MKKRTRNLLIGTGIAAAGAAAAGAAAYKLTNTLVKVAMDRETPEMAQTREKVRGAAPSPFDRETEEMARQLEQQDTQRVEILSYDGEKLVGHWLPSAHPRRIIVAMHGWRSSWARDFGAIAPFWREEECSVLYAEQRGQNASGGDYMGFGMIERYDCLEWLKWVNARGEGLPVYLAGVSMGATTVLMTASLAPLPHVHGILADCGFTSAHAEWKHVVEKNLHLSYGVMGKMASDLCRQKIQVGTDGYSTQEALAGSSTPVLFIHGTADTFVPIEMTYENYQVCTAPKRLLVVPGAGHGESYYVDREGYQAALRRFWADFDGQEPSTDQEPSAGGEEA